MFIQAGRGFVESRSKRSMDASLLSSSELGPGELDVQGEAQVAGGFGHGKAPSDSLEQ